MSLVWSSQHVARGCGPGKDGVGTSGLPDLDKANLPGATVSVRSATVSDARSTYFDGIISAINAKASGIGIAVERAGGCSGFVSQAVVLAWLSSDEAVADRWQRGGKNRANSHSRCGSWRGLVTSPPR